MPSRSGPSMFDRSEAHSAQRAGQGPAAARPCPLERPLRAGQAANPPASELSLLRAESTPSSCSIHEQASIVKVARSPQRRYDGFARSSQASGAQRATRVVVRDYNSGFFMSQIMGGSWSGAGERSRADGALSILTHRRATRKQFRAYALSMIDHREGVQRVSRGAPACYDGFAAPSWRSSSGATRVVVHHHDSGFFAPQIMAGAAP